MSVPRALTVAQYAQSICFFAAPFLKLAECNHDQFSFLEQSPARLVFNRFMQRRVDKLL